MCLLSECKGTERGAVRIARRSSPGRPSSARCLPRGSIAAWETEGESAHNTSGRTTGGLLCFGQNIRNYFKPKKAGLVYLLRRL